MKHNVDTLRLVLSAAMVELARYTMPDLNRARFGGGAAWAAYIGTTVWAISTAVESGTEDRRIDSTFKAMTLTVIAFALTFASRATMIPGWEVAWMPVLFCFVLFNVMGTVRFNFK